MGRKTHEPDGECPPDYSVSVRWHDGITGQEHTTHMVLSREEMNLAAGRTVLEARARELYGQGTDVVVDKTEVRRIDE